GTAHWGKAIADLTVRRDEPAVGQENGDLGDIGEGHVGALQHLADVLPDLLDLLFDAGLQFALGIDADLPRDIEQPRTLWHLGAEAVFAGERHGLGIMKLDGHLWRPHLLSCRPERSEGPHRRSPPA